MPALYGDFEVSLMDD